VLSPYLQATYKVVNQTYTDPTTRPTTYNLSWLYDFKYGWRIYTSWNITL